MNNRHIVEILRQLSVLHAPEGKPFILKSGKESMHYVDVRLTALDPHGLNVLSEGLFLTALSLRIDVTHAAGVALGGCPLATGVCQQSLRHSLGSYPDIFPAWKTLYVRPEAKDHGTGKLIEGSFQPGAAVVLFEDVVTSGGSTLKAIATLREAGLQVRGVVAVLDREEGGGAKIASECPFRALTTLKELLAEAP